MSRRFDLPLGDLLKYLMTSIRPAIEQYSTERLDNQELRLAAAAFVEAWDEANPEAISFCLIRLREAIVDAQPAMTEEETT